MDIKRISRLITIMNEENLAELEVEDDDFKIKVIKPQGSSIIKSKSVIHKPETLPPESIPIKDKDMKKKTVKVTSPMVGFFYLSRTPTSPPYVKVGDRVSPTQIVGIVEVMGVINEVKAKVKGKVMEILVEDGCPVEYGQPLFLVEPDEGEENV